MSETLVEWMAVLVFVLLFVCGIISEVQWLLRKGWTDPGRAVGYVLITDLLGLGVGSFVVFTSFFVMFMMVMGPAGRGGTAPEAAYWAVSAIALVVPPVLFVLSKRLFLFIFKITSGKTAWNYSVVISLLIILVVIIPPPLFFYLIVILWK